MKASGNPETPEGPKDLTAAEVDIVLDYLLGHKMRFLQDFLRERRLPFAGTKEVLRNRLIAYISDARVSSMELVRLLDGIEGWGNQHIYLYKAPDQSIEPWRTERSSRRRLSTLKLDDLFNRHRPLVLPAEPTLSSIEWTPQKLRLVWVEKRQWEERLPEHDIENEDLILRAYRRNVTRGLTAFDWDLLTGHAMLMIQILPSGSKYDQARDRFEEQLEPMVVLSNFQRVRVGPAIQSIEKSDEARRRQLAYETRRGGKASLTSASQSSDAYTDPDLQTIGESLRGKTAGLMGNFYWHRVDGALDRELHIKLYAADQSVGIFGECREQEVRYVISRIRHYSR
jgi:hypothetical protein